MENDLREVAVTNLSITCGYVLPKGTPAAGRYCGLRADTAVGLLNDTFLGRCPDHRGLIKDNEPGTVYKTVFTRQEVPDDVVVSWPER